MMSKNTCKNCGVELENELLKCPLCNEIIEFKESEKSSQLRVQTELFQNRERMGGKKRKFIWEIISIILLSGSSSTFVIDLVINKMITWSQYPAAISLVVFSYISVFAFWNRKTAVQMIAGLLFSVISLIGIDVWDSSIDWSLGIGIPILLSGNVVIGLMISGFRIFKSKGINLIAYGFFGVLLQCLFIEGILSMFNSGKIQLQWSVIVAGCIIPIICVLFLVHIRQKKKEQLERTFHL